MSQSTKIRVGPDKHWEVLYSLREMTRRTGILSELQVLQLKMWPMVFTNAVESECSFGFETKQVLFNLKLPKRRPTKFTQRLEHLAKATQQLLGPEYGVLINVDGKKVFYGEPTSDS